MANASKRPPRPKTRARPEPKSPRRARQRSAPTTPAKAGHRLLALDISSVAVGWAVFDNADPMNLVAHGRFLQQGADHGEKLLNFALWLQQHLAQWDPTEVAYEAPYAGRKRFTYGVLMMYVAVVLMIHIQHFGTEVPKVNRVAAHLVKKRIRVRKGASHEENKKIVVLWANETYGLSLKFKANDKTKKVSQDDEADGIAVGYARLIAPGDDAE